METQPGEGEEANSLEDPGTGAPKAPEPETKAPKKKNNLVKGLIGRLNIYLLIFIFIIVLVSGFTFVSIQRNKKSEAPTTIGTKELTQEDLKKLASTNSSVGDAKQTLSVESNAIFAGKVLIRDSLDVAGTIKVGGAISLPGITVSGTSNFDQIQGNKLAITGDANFQGAVTIQKSLTTSGGATFGGPISAPQITVQSLQLTGDFTISRHIDAGGATPGKVDGGALGSGGSSSVSGTDTAGTITINTGGGPGAGCLVTINFTQRFNTTPHVVVTPIGAAAANLAYYVTRNGTSFTLCTANAAPASANFSFDYIVID